MKRFNHRCKNCWHPWYTEKRDSQALCPKCKSSEIELYIIAPKEVSSPSTRFELILCLTIANLLLFAGIITLVVLLLA